MSSPDDTTHLIGPEPSPIEELSISLTHWENYKIQTLLGEGGMGRVYKAFDPKLNRYLALKFIRSDNENLKKRLLREAKAQAQIEHDHVCKIYETGEVDGKPYIAMQLINGRTLQELVKEMSLEQKVLVMQQISDAVQVAHKIGIIHRDIKPSNIMLERKDDGSYRPFIMDFGIAREISEPGITATNVVVGTPSYMAPEHLTGNHQAVDRRVDIYSLGATMYYIFSGKPPFQGSAMDVLVRMASEDPIPLTKEVPSIPSDLDVIISKCLEKEPSRRYDSARALADDLKRYLDGEPILAKRSSLKYRVLKKIKKNKTTAGILAIASLTVIALAIFSVFSYWRASKQVQIARQFSQYVESMDWLMRVAYMSPLHDIGKEKTQVTKQMQEIEKMMKDAGNAATGPGNFALGSGFLALHDYDKARSRLEQAWSAGYREKEVATALGLTLGALYKRKLTEVDRISDVETRKIKLQEVEKEYRNLAVQYLRMGSEVRSRSREYGEALLAYYEKKWDTALQLARSSFQKFPWLYEARALEGDVFSRLGEQAFQEGNFEMAMKQFLAGADSYAKAGEVSRSDPVLFESQCLLSRSVMETQFATGNDGKKEYDESNAYCKNALIANPGSSTALELLAETAWRWGENQWILGEDPVPVWRESIKMSRKAQVLNPESAYAFYLMGTAYGFLADYEIEKGIDPTVSLNQSIESNLIAIKKDPNSPSSYTNLGVSYFSQGVLGKERGQESDSFFLKAIEAYEKALRISPRHIAARANIANAFRLLAQNLMDKGADPTSYLVQSIDNYKKALEINPNHWMIHSNLAAVYANQMRHELDHGKDINVSFQNAIKETQISDSLKEGNWYSVINSAEDFVYHAEYALQRNEDPSPWIKKAEERLAPVLENHDFVEAFLTIAEAKRFEAEYFIQQKISPLPSLQKANQALDRAIQVNSKEQLIPLGRARLELIRATWFIMNHQPPDSALKNAELELRKTLELNPRSALAYSMLGEFNLRKSEWKNILKKNASTEIQQGLSSIEKSLAIKPDLAQAYVISANLLIIEAQTKSDQKTCEKSVEKFVKAFEINPMLQNKEQDHFEKAKSLCAKL